MDTEYKTWSHQEMMIVLSLYKSAFSSVSQLQKLQYLQPHSENEIYLDFIVYF